MRAGFFIAYALRTLLRGGQRTLLAVFCIAVGVAAIVGLQLAANSVRAAIASNARAVNQGDVNLGFQSAPLGQSDLAFFEDLKARGAITGYTAEASSGGILQSSGGRRTVSVRAVDPATFPLVGGGSASGPRGQKLITELAEPGSAIASSRLANDLHLSVGANVRVLLTNGTLAQLHLSGIAPAEDVAWSGNGLTVSLATWTAETKGPAAIQAVAVTTADDAHTKVAIAQIRRQFPLASVRTTADVLRQADKAVETTRRFLITIGLLALLIGGVGIVNTMQVLLSRRRVEIAVLKTVGFRRRDLYACFALEAAIVGVAGGVLGAAGGVGVAAGLRALFVRFFPIVLPLQLDRGVVLSGVGIGLATALIFGILPIVEAAAIRPQAVLRDLPEWRAPSSRLASIALVLLLALLFCLLASIILHSLLWGAVFVFGGFALLGALSVALSAVLWVLTKLPVPERYSPGYLALVSVAVAVSLAVARVASLRGVGILALIFALLGYAVVVLPRNWKLNVKLALRNIGRTRGRTTTTLLALFVGVFAVGLILVLDQDLKSNLGGAVASQLDYNAVAVTPVSSRAELQDQLASLPGLRGYRASNFAAASAVAINGRPIAGRALRGGPSASSSRRRQLRLLAGIQGFDLSSDELPGSLQVTSGRALEATDAGSQNVIVSESLREAPLRLSPGDRVTLKRLNGDTTETLTIVGFYRIDANSARASFNLAPVFGSQEAALQLAGDTPYEIFYLNITPERVAQAIDRLEIAAPDAVVVDLDDFLAQFEQVLSNILIMLTAIASLALAAGVVIVANAVALAMLERRRELGILKAVGYGSNRVLGGVLIENALTAGLGGLLGMAPVSLAVFVFDRQAGVQFGVPALLSILVVLGVVALTTATTVLVASGAVRVRPLSVLRYE